MPKAVAQMQAVRDAVGLSIGLMVDLWRRLDWASAAQFCTGVADCDLVFVEEPTEFQSADALARLSSATRTRPGSASRSTR